MDFLKSAVASAVARGPLAAYSLQDRVEVDSSVWTLNNAIKRDTGARCSVFSFDVTPNKSRLPIAKNAVRKARTLHHPGVVKVIETIETDSQICICTERLTPLSWFTKRKSLTEETAKWGLCNVATTVKFINEDASSIHGCVRSSSIYVSDSGEWKVGGFELLSSVKDEEAVIYLYGGLVPDSGRYAPPEVGKSGWDGIRNNPVSSVDSYGFGVLVYEAFNGSFPGSDQALQPRDLPPSMQQAYKRLMNPNPKLRLSVAHFLDQGRRNGGFFQTPLINLSQSLESLGLKSEGERDDFLTELNEVADQYPEDYMKRKILPELLKSVEFGGGGAKVFSVVLKIGAKLSPDEYETQLTPVLVRLFASPDRAIRVCLLENLPLMIDHISAKVINEKVFPNMVTGFTDVAPLVREQTVKSVLVIITKLSERTINGELLKYLAKTSNDVEPGIRTNTIICLGKISRNLGQSSRSKILIAAFTRSLKDPFIHARNAALLALGATAELFTDDDCAGKILPAICPVLLDKEKPIRDQANKTLNLFLTKVRKVGDAMPETATPPGAAQESVHSKNPREPANAVSSADSTSWTGWAISSFTSKGAPTVKSGDLRPETPKASGTLQPKEEVQLRPREPDRMSQQSSTVSSPQPDPVFQDEYDAWGDSNTNAEDAGNGWGDEDDMWGSNTATTSTAASTTQDGEPDFAAWLAAKSANKGAKKPGLPKGLAPKASAKGVNGNARPAVATKSASTGSVIAAKKAVAPAKPTPKAPVVETEAEDDDWGSAWD